MSKFNKKMEGQPCSQPPSINFFQFINFKPNLMKNNFLHSLWMVLLLCLTFSSDISSQCTSTSPFAGVTANNTGAAQTLTTCNFTGEFSPYAGVVAGNTYIFTAIGGAGNFLTVRQTNGTGTLVASGLSPLTVTPTVSGTLAVVVNTSAACGTDVSCHAIYANRVLPPPANDACASAVALTPAAVPALTAGTTIGASYSTQATTTCSGSSNPGPLSLDVWYSFTATGTNAYTANLTSAFDGIIAVYNGTCAAPVFIGCVDLAVAGGTESLSLGQLAVGSYLTRVYGWTGAIGTFNVSVVAGSALPPLNDDCSSATTLPPEAVPTPTPGTIVNATSTVLPPNAACPSTSSTDVWYKFSAATGFKYTVDLAPNFDGVIAVYSGTCATLTALPVSTIFPANCADNFFGNETLPLGSLPVLPTGSFYYVRVYGFNGASGTFNIGVTALPCGITVQCPSSPTTPFNCTTPIPAAVTTVAAFNALGGSIAGTPCGTVVITNVTGTPNLCAGGTVSRVYTIFDDINNNGVLNTPEVAITCTLSYNYVGDVTPPTIVCPAPPPAASCATTLPPGLPFTGTATDNCAGTPVVTFVDAAPSAVTCVNRFTVIRTYTATDACNRTATCSLPIVVNDQTAPTITCPAPINFVCASAIPAPTPLTVVASDNCTGVAVVTFVNDVNTNSICANKYSVTRTYRATDLCGNSATCSQLIAINDNVAPTITCPATATLACATLIPPALPFLGTAVDNCTGSVTVTAGTEQSYPGSCYDPLTKIRVYTATDACGNAATCQQTIKVAPQLVTPPTNLTLDACFNDQDYLNWLNARGGATFSCNTVFNWQREEYDFVQLACPQLRGWKVLFTGTSAAGSVICFSANVTVVEEGAPFWDMLPMNKTVNCSDANANASINMWLASNGGAWLLDCGTQLSQLVVTNNYTSAPVTCGPRVVTFTATDLCGNSSTASAVLTRIDNTPPVITNVPANTTITCPAVPTFAAPTATDACGAATLSFTDVSTGGPCPAMYMVVRTWVATDACGNTSTKTAKVTVNASTATPTGTLTFVCLNNQVVTAASGTGSAVVNYTAPTGTSTCTVGSVTVVLTSGLASGAAFPIGVSTIVHTATDGCGNVKTCSFTVTVNAGNPNPTGVLTLNCTANQTVTAATGANSAIVNFSSPIGTSTCTIGSVSTSQTSGLTSGSAFPVGVSSVVFTAIDGCGNTKTCIVTITVNAANTPNPSVITLNVPPNQSLGCGQIPAFGTATASSTCTTASSSVTFVDATAGSACIGFTATRTFTATDGCGNTKIGQQIITIAGDVSAPTFANVPNNATVACGAAISFGTATATDACGVFTVNAPVTFVDLAATGSCSAGYTYRRVFTATDACGKTSTAAQTISTSPDNAGPTFTSLPPQDMMIGCNTPVNIGTATATDACTPASVTITSTTTTNGGATGCNTVNGITYGYDVYTTWKATDACGNTTIANTNVWVIPNGMAFLAIPDNKSATCGQNLVWDAAPMVKSTFGPIMTTTFEDIMDVNSCGAGTASRLWTATDDQGNTAQAMQVITLMPDTELPQIFISEPNIAVNCDELAAMSAPIVSDNCAAVSQIQVEFTDVKIGNVITRTWAATDVCGNRKEANQTITMMDTFAPEFNFVPANESLTCGQTPSNATATALDNCAATVIIGFSDAINGNITTRTWSATDAMGNVNFATQTIERITDNTAPTFSFVPANESLTCGQIASNATATASDNCASVVIIGFTDAVNGNITTRTWSAMDLNGNVKLATQTIERIADNIAPEFSFVPANESLTCGQTPNNATATASDNCASDVIIGFSDAVNGNITTRTWSAMDLNGNVKLATQTIERIADNIAPTFSFVPANQSLTCGQIANNELANATDNCSDQVIISFTEVTDGNITTRTWSATDENGNINLADQIIERIADITAPVFASLPINKTIACDQTPVFEVLSANDACSDVVVSFVDALNNTACEQVHTRTWTAIDAAGNETIAQQIITVKDEIAPIFSFVPEDKELDCASNIQFGTPLASDFCSDVVIVQNDTELASTCGNSGQTIIRTWTASDVCGNLTLATQRLHVLEDVIAPIFTEQVTASVEMTFAAFNAWQPNSPASTDACDNEVTVTSTLVQIDECNHEVTYTTSDLCGNTVSQLQKIHISDGSCAPSGTNGLEKNSIKIYPNPASEVLFVETINNAILLGTRYEVIDMWGRILVSGTLNTNLETLNISNLPAANYTLRIFMEEKPLVLMFEKTTK
jgi:large repetitive protein